VDLRVSKHFNLVWTTYSRACQFVSTGIILVRFSFWHRYWLIFRSQWESVLDCQDKPVGLNTHVLYLFVLCIKTKNFVVVLQSRYNSGAAMHQWPFVLLVWLTVSAAGPVWGRQWHLSCSQLLLLSAGSSHGGRSSSGLSLQVVIYAFSLVTHTCTLSTDFSTSVSVSWSFFRGLKGKLQRVLKWYFMA